MMKHKSLKMYPIPPNAVHNHRYGTSVATISPKKKRNSRKRLHKMDEHVQLNVQPELNINMRASEDEVFGLMVETHPKYNTLLKPECHTSVDTKELLQNIRKIKKKKTHLHPDLSSIARN